MKCPYCGSGNVQCDEVDIGVGMQQCGPYGCDDCHAVELSPQLTEAERAALSDEERRTGWRR